MKLPPVNYAAPPTVAEACRLLAADEDAKAMAGGQSLIPLMAIRLAAPSTVVDISKVPGLSDISVEADHLRIGALCTHQRVIDSESIRAHAPLLAEAGNHIAHHAIRSRGTIGGSLAHGDGAAEWPLTLLALGGEVEVESVRGQRRIPVDDLFVGPFLTLIEHDELVVAVRVPRHGPSWSFGEYARRSGDYGLAAVAVLLDIQDGACRAARIAIGAAVSTVQRATAAEMELTGAPVTPEAAARAAAAAAAAVPVVSDLHGSESYRRRLVDALITRTITEAAVRA